MNTTPDLDEFEAQLLADLREHVADRATAPEPQASKPARRGRILMGVAAAAAVAVAVPFTLPGGGTPAYAVEKASDGEVVVTVHRLEDSAALEQELQDAGIDATVDFYATGDDPWRFSIGDGDPDTGDVSPDDVPDDADTVIVDGSDVPAGSGAMGHADEDGASWQVWPSDGTDDWPHEGGEEPLDMAGCDLGADPATLTQVDDAWVLRIPAESPLHDRAVLFTTGAGGELAVQYAGDHPDSLCGVLNF